jgi:hypothetical protein
VIQYIDIRDLEPTIISGATLTRHNILTTNSVVDGYDVDLIHHGLL